MIPDEAVQAARVKLEDVLGGWFDDLDAIRQILEVAAPYIKAQAWEEGAVAGWSQTLEGWNAEYPDEGTGKWSVNLTQNPYRKEAK